jgi:Zn-dependent protease with chaperone function
MTIFAAVVFHAAGHARRRHDAHRMLLTATALLAIIVGGIWLLPSGPPHP